MCAVWSVQDESHQTETCDLEEILGGSNGTNIYFCASFHIFLWQNPT